MYVDKHLQYILFIFRIVAPYHTAVVSKVWGAPHWSDATRRLWGTEYYVSYVVKLNLL